MLTLQEINDSIKNQEAIITQQQQIVTQAEQQLQRQFGALEILRQLKARYEAPAPSSNEQALIDYEDDKKLKVLPEDP